MEHLTEDYVLDTDYTWGYYGGQSPNVMGYAARLNGVMPPSVGDHFRYLELGCGNGVTTNILASTFPRAEFVAIDLNSEHIENARSLAVAGNLSNVRFDVSSFAEFSNTNEEQFDFISLHGVYSWVGEAVRQDILKVLSRHLKTGGLVYVSYNAMPGWAALSPLRQLMVTYAANKSGSSIERALASIKYLEFLRDNNAAYFVKYPECQKFVESLLDLDPKYIVHEYFNSNWQPQYFSEVAKEMSTVGLRFCGTTIWSKNYLDLCIPKEFQPLLMSADSDYTREAHKSLILNERFRIDIYAKNAEVITGSRRSDLFDDLYFSNVVPVTEISRKINIGTVEVNYGADIYDVIIPILCEGQSSLADLCERKELARYAKPFIIDSVINLIPGGQFQAMLRPAKPQSLAAGDSFRICSDLNRAMLEERLYVDGGCYLMSPVLGSALQIDLMTGLVILGSDAVGPKAAIDWAIDKLAEKGQTLQVDGETIDNRNTCRRLLSDEQKKFVRRGLHLLEKFGVIESSG